MSIYDDKTFNIEFWSKWVYNFDFDDKISCQIEINYLGFWLCYVIIPKNHKLANLGFNTVNKKLDYDIHYGFTTGMGIKYGFDTGHFGDLNVLPVKDGKTSKFTMRKEDKENPKRIWTFNTVKQETFNIARAFSEYN